MSWGWRKHIHTLRSQEIMNWRIPWFLQQGILEGKFGSFHILPYLFWPFTFFVCLLLEMVIWELWCYREKCDNSLHLFIDFYFQNIDNNFFLNNFRAAKGDLVPFALLHLLHCLLSKSASVSGAAYTEIRALVAAKSVKLQNFFSQYKKPICQVRFSTGLD